MDAQTLAMLKGMADVYELVKAQYKHDLPTGFTTTTNLVHGPTGIFSAPGIDRQVFATRIQPRGLASLLTSRMSNDDSPLVGYVTGFTDDESGSEQTNKCDDPLEAGEMKSCLQGSAFGRMTRKTKPLALVDLGRRNNRSEFDDLVMVNDPIFNDAGGTLVPGLPQNAQAAFRSELAVRLLTLASAFENLILPKIYTGTPSNNTGGEGYKEFTGLETLVGTGKVDVLTGTACPSLDSDIKEFNYGTVSSNMDTLFYVMTTLYRYLQHNASQMNFGAVKWVWVMRGDLFNEIVDRWPCVYATFRCGGSAGTPNNTDAMAMREMSDAMRNGKYLRIDGVDIPVVIDDGIPEDTNTNNSHVPSGSFGSDIYLLPLTVRGGLPVTFFEFFNYDSEVTRTIADARLGNVAYVSDGGRFLWYSQFTNGCFSMAATVEPRLRLLTPQLAGRIQNIVYSPLQHLRDPFISSAYFVDGGRIVRDTAPY